MRRDGGRGGYHAWQGGALIARRRTSRRTGVVGRLEYYHDPAGVLAATRAGGLRTAGYSLGFDSIASIRNAFCLASVPSTGPIDPHT